MHADDGERLAGLEQRAELGDRGGRQPIAGQPWPHLPVLLEPFGAGDGGLARRAARRRVELAFEGQQVPAGRVVAQRRTVTPAQARRPVEGPQHAGPSPIRAHEAASARTVRARTSYASSMSAGATVVR